MKLGIVGLPNVGKSTLFNSLTKAKIDVANYPFCTIDPNVGVVAVPDDRLEKLAKFYDSDKITPAVIEFVDIAGLVKGASSGEGLGNKFLGNIRETDAIIHVVRCFDDDNIIHVDGFVDPLRDIDTIRLELIFADVDVIEKRLTKGLKGKNNDPKVKAEAELLQRLKEHLEGGNDARSFERANDDEEVIIKNLFLLTDKPVIYAMNVSEDEVASSDDNEYVKNVKAFAKESGAESYKICASLEYDLADLEEDEKKEMLDELGISESGLDRLIKASYSLLGLTSFLTAGKQEVRAWTIKKATKAPQAAGKIHTDFEKGFIKAEVVNCYDLLEAGSYNAAKEKALVRIEGKDYVVREDDVILFRFNV